MPRATNQRVTAVDRFVSSVISQFGRPRGIWGILVGFVLAHRSSNVQRGQWTVDLLRLSPSNRVLEIGCGPGVALNACLERLKEGTATGVDHSDVMIEQARRRNARAFDSKRLMLVAGTLEDLPANGASFDRIFSINVIQFISDKGPFIDACVQRLAPNGVLATTFQPRGREPTRDAALAMARTLAELKTNSGLIDVRTEILEMGSVPAICVLGKRS